MSVYYSYYDSPVGQLLIATTAHGLYGIEFPKSRHPLKRSSEWIHAHQPLFDEVSRQLELYFSGQLQKFDLPLDLRGTDFQTSVWKTLATIPYGETWTYAQLANAISNPKAMRAVGNANGKNPIPIILPCHRVIGSNGALTGFSGGLETKHYLLTLEKGEQPDLLQSIQ